MSQNRATIAWIVLLLSFFACTLVALGVPASVKWYFAQALRVDAAKLEVISGTAIILERGRAQETATVSTATVHEGDVVRAGANSQVMLWLPGGSNVRLWPDSSIGVVRLRSSQYNQNNAVIELQQTAGHTRIEVAMLSTLARTFVISTPDSLATLREGSYSLDVQPGVSELTNHYGSATIEASGRSVELLKGERSVVAAGSDQIDPMPSARNLVANGDFANGLAGWQAGNRDEEEPVLGAVTPLVTDGLSAIQFLRTGASKHVETYLVQSLNRDVTDFQSLKLGLDLKLIGQSLSGGGWLGSEYPLMIRVKYRDVWGSEGSFRRGYYFRNEEQHPTTSGQQVPHNVWLKGGEYDLFNRSVTDPRPSYIISVELAASGWNFESLATNVRLIAE